jgi:hypothetical protein
LPRIQGVRVARVSGPDVVLRGPGASRVTRAAERRVILEGRERAPGSIETAAMRRPTGSHRGDGHVLGRGYPTQRDGRSTSPPPCMRAGAGGRLF